MPGSAASVIASHRGPLAARGAAATMTAAMRVIEQRRTFVHTHFVTDGERLPSDRVREIERGVLPVLRALGIVFGIHLAPPTPPGGIEIVLECIPAEAGLAGFLRKPFSVADLERAVGEAAR